MMAAQASAAALTDDCHCHEAATNAATLTTMVLGAALPTEHLCHSIAVQMLTAALANDRHCQEAAAATEVLVATVSGLDLPPARLHYITAVLNGGTH